MKTRMATINYFTWKLHILQQSKNCKRRRISHTFSINPGVHDCRIPTTLAPLADNSQAPFWYPGSATALGTPEMATLLTLLKPPREWPRRTVGAALQNWAAPQLRNWSKKIGSLALNWKIPRRSPNTPAQQQPLRLARSGVKHQTLST
jgi:hypothetical protein